MNYAGKFGAEFFVDNLGLHSGGQVHTETIHATHAPQEAIVVSDAQLLFNGEFKRSGVDLVLSNADRELVLHDYFKGEKRAALSSPDGAHLSGDLVSALAGHVEYAQADGNVSVNAVIGHVTKLVGTATAIRNGVSIILNNGDNVEKGDVVTSGSDSTLGITFIDGTVFGLSSNARMVLNEMVYDPNGSNNSSLLSLVAGTMTFVAGETAKHGDMKVDTPVATMGIRGTAVLVEIDFTVPGQGAPDARFQVLVEPDGTTGSYILFDKTTLTPLAVVNQAGQQINISNGLISQTLAPLSPEIQKLIQDVFSLKFTDNSNTKSIQHFTDTVVPTSFGSSNFASLTGVPVIIPALITTVGLPSTGDSGSGLPFAHQHEAPHVAATNGTILARFGASSGQDTVTGTITFADVNPFDHPTVTVKPASFTLQQGGNDITATLSAQQLANIQALETALTLAANAGNQNNGTYNWTYSVPASALGFLTPGSTLTLTYNATADNNFAPDDLKGVTSFTITIKTTAEIWSEITQKPSPAPGDWNNGANWETGVAPTAADDVFIITDPTRSGTPFYPVTVKSAENGGIAAFANSLTMDDVDNIAAPELDNFNTLTIGNGGLHLNADSLLKNFGTLSIGGIAEILQSSVLQNSGHVTLAQGGDFKDLSQITNSGILEVAGGALNVEVDVANSGGTLQVDANAAMMLANGATVAGGALTLGANSILHVESSQGATLDGVTVTGTDVGPSAVDIGINTDGGSTLTLEGGTSVIDGLMEIAAGSTLDVESAGGATLDGVAVIGFGGEAPSKIDIGINADGGSTLTLRDGTSISNIDMTIADGTLDVESAGGATLDGVTVAGMAPAAIEIGVNTEGGSILRLSDGTSIINGDMFISADSTLDIESAGGATLDAVRLINEGTILVDGGTTLHILHSTTITDGALNIAGLGVLDLESGAAFDHVTVNGTNGLKGSEILISGAVTLQGETTVNDGELAIAKMATLDIENPVTGTGASLNGVDVMNLGTIQVDRDGLGTTVINLLLDEGTKVNGGTLLIHVGFPTNSIEGTVEIGAGGATLDNVNVINNNALAIDPSAALTIDDGTSINGGNLSFGGGGALDVTIDGATLNGVTVIGTNADRLGTASTIEVGAVTGTVLTLEGGTSIIDGDLKIDSGSTLDIETSQGATLDGVNVANAGTIQVDGPFGPPPAPPVNLVLDGGTTISGGTLLIHDPLSADEGTVEIGSGGATFDHVTVINNNELIVDPLVTLTLTDGTSIDGGIIADAGTLLVTTASEIRNATVDCGGNITVTSTALSLSEVTLDNVTLSGNFTNVDTLTINDTVALNGATLSGGTIVDTNTLFVTTSSEIENATVDGGGSVTVSTGVTLTLDKDTLTDLTLAGGNDDLAGDTTTSSGATTISDATVQDGTLSVGSTTLTLDGDTLTDLTLTGGTVDLAGNTTTVSGATTISDATVQDGTLSVTDGATLTLDDGTMITGGNLIIARGSTLDTEAGPGATLDGVKVTNSGTIQVDGVVGFATTVTLVLDGGTEIAGGKLLIHVASSSTEGVVKIGTGGAIFNDVTVINNNEVTIDPSVTLTLEGGTTISGGTIDDSGAISGYGAIGSVIGGSGVVAASGGTLTLSGLNTYSGMTTIDSGAVLVASATGAFSASSVVTDNGELDLGTTNQIIAALNGTNTAALVGSFSGTGTSPAVLTIGDGGSFAGVIEDGTTGAATALTLTAGTLTLSSDNTYTGVTTINGGALALSGASSIADSSDVIDEGSFDLSGLTAAGASIVTLSGNGLVALGSKTLTLTNASTTFSGAFSSTGGGVTVAAGTLILGTMTLDDLTLAGRFNDSGTLTIDDAVTLNGATISGGTLDISGTLDSSGISVINDATIINTDHIDVVSGTLTIDPTPLINTGTFEVQSFAVLSGEVTTNGIIQEVVTNTDGVIQIDQNGMLTLFDTTINGGTIVDHGTLLITGTTSKLVDVTFTGPASLDISSNATFEIDGLVSSGVTVTLEQGGQVATTLTLSDSHHFYGTIAGLLENDSNENLESRVDLLDLAYLSGQSGHTRAVYSDGQVTVTDINSHNQIVDSVKLNVSGSTSGSFEVTSDGHGGTYLADPSTTGNVTIDSDQTLSTSAASSNTVTFTNNSGNAGELVLADSKDFTGVIAGFAGDGTTANSDLIDVTDVNIADVALNKTTYTDNGSGTGTLTLYNANGQTLDNIIFSGNYQLANFTIENDGAGHTLIVDPPVDTGSQAPAAIAIQSPASAPSGSIVASAPNQALTGSAPGDNFVFNFAGMGHSTIAGFDVATDTLQFSSSIFANVQAALNATHDDGHGNAIIAIDTHDSVTLNGVLKAQLHAHDFHFV